MSKSVLEGIRKLPEASRRTYYFNMLYYETWRHGWLLADQIVLVFRFAAKMEKERKRLGCLEVGNSGSLVDSLEERVCNFLKGPPSDEQQQVREVFEKTAGHPARDREKIVADRLEFKKRRTRHTTK